MDRFKIFKEQNSEKFKPEFKLEEKIYNPKNVWSSKGSTEGHDGDNWSNGELRETDVLIFNGTSNVDCIFKDVVCNTIDIQKDYKGVFSSNSLTMHCVEITSTAADFYTNMNMDSTWTMSGSWK